MRAGIIGLLALLLTATACVAPTAAEPAPDNSALPQSVRGNAYVLGNPNAPVTVEEYADYQCTACGQFTRSVLPQLRKNYVETGKVRIIWRDFPWIGSESVEAAQAARCAGAQGHFWDYHDYLYAHQRGENRGQFSKDNLKRFAGDIHLDTAGFGQCLDAGADLQQLRDLARSVPAKGMRGTPSFTINGRLFVSATYDQFSRAIDTQLARGG